MFEVENPALSALIRGLFGIHILAGVTALGIFLIPMLTKKGGTVHRKTGWIYTISMVIVGTGAFSITLWRIFVDPSASTEHRLFSVFLFFVAVLSLSSVWFGIRALKLKTRTKPDLSPMNAVPVYILLFSALATSVLGISNGEAILTYFPIVGLGTATRHFMYWSRPTTSKMHWWYAHMYGMFVACIATITAFLVTAAPRIWPYTGHSLLLWLSPTLILLPILRLWTSRYKKKFGDI